MRMNTGQQDAISDVIKFINNPNQKYYYITGDAGTGKTFLLSYLARNILNYAKSGSGLHSVEVTATTNKAAAVISATGISAGTIYSFMNLRVQENFSTGEVKCIPTKNWMVHSGTLIIIDEISMANKELMKFLEDGTDKTCKILGVGDKNQLAPVKEEISQVFKRGYDYSVLTEMVRNVNQPALMALCEQAKQTVITGDFTRIKEVPGVIDFVGGGQVLKGVLERDYSTENLDRRVLCYTNSRVSEYNRHIRTLRGYTKPFEKGEILTNNSASKTTTNDALYTDQILEVHKILGRQQDSSILSGNDFDIVTVQMREMGMDKFHTVECFADPTDRQALMKHFASSKKWDRYFRIKNNYPDLRPTAASTTHKAQGSTYDSVVVDLGDIGKASNRSQIARMQYVALSRPKNRIFIRGQLPDRLF